MGQVSGSVVCPACIPTKLRFTNRYNSAYVDVPVVNGGYSAYVNAGSYSVKAWHTNLKWFVTLPGIVNITTYPQYFNFTTDCGRDEGTVTKASGGDDLKMMEFETFEQLCRWYLEMVQKGPAPDYSFGVCYSESRDGGGDICYDMSFIGHVGAAPFGEAPPEPGGPPDLRIGRPPQLLK